MTSSQPGRFQASQLPGTGMPATLRNVFRRKILEGRARIFNVARALSSAAEAIALGAEV